MIANIKIKSDIIKHTNIPIWAVIEMSCVRLKFTFAVFLHNDILCILDGGATLLIFAVYSFFEKRASQVAQVGLELTEILLLLSPKCWKFVMYHHHTSPLNIP